MNIYDEKKMYMMKKLLKIAEIATLPKTHSFQTIDDTDHKF